ncbi:MAG: hypothetical protein ACI9KE_004596 [Polyangiales bacterium]|jgi:hypothetical protein
MRRNIIFDGTPVRVLMSRRRSRVMFAFRRNLGDVSRVSKDKKASPPVVLPILLAGVFGLVGSFAAGERVIVPLTDDGMRGQLHDYVSHLDGEAPPLADSGFEDVTGLEWRRSIPLEPYECVMLGLVASASEFSLQLQVPSRERRAMRAAQSYCAEAEATSADFVATFETPSRVYVEESRSLAHQLDQYTIKANFLDNAYLEERWPSELMRRAVRAREAGSRGELLSGPHRVEAENTALLIPDDEQLMRVVHESSFLGLASRPEVDFRVQSTTGEISGTVAPSVRVEGTLRSLVVAVDPRENAFCTSVGIWPTLARSQEIGAITHPGAVVSPNVGNRVVVCPEDGTTLIYAAPAQYDVYLRRAQDAEPQPRTHVVMTMSDALRDFLSECEAGDAGACRQAATRYETGIGTTPDLAKAGDLIARACELGPSYCLDAAGFVSGARQSAAILRACGAGGAKDACAVLGARYRTGEGQPVNYAYARAAYQRACTLGASCDEAQHMLDLGLTDEDEDEVSAIALGFVSADDVSADDVSADDVSADDVSADDVSADDVALEPER